MQVGAQRIVYWQSREEGPAVVLLHGNSVSHRIFERQFQSPLAEKYRLIAPNLPGNGESPPAVDPERTYSMPGLVDLMVGFLDALNLQRSVVLGWSVGGNVWLEAVPMLQDLRGIVLVGTAPVPKPLDFALFPHPDMALLFQEQLSSEEISRLGDAILGPTKEPNIVAELFGASDGRFRSMLGQSVGLGKHEDEVKILRELRVPIAMFLGERDDWVRLEYLQSLKAPSLWRHAVQTIPGGTHMCQWTNPEAFNALLDEFLQDEMV